MEIWPTKIIKDTNQFFLGSPIADRVHLFEKAMKESSGLKSKDTKAKDPLRR